MESYKMSGVEEPKRPSKRPLLAAVLLGSLVICGAIIFAAIWVVDHRDDDCPPVTPTVPVASEYKSGNGVYKYAAVAADSAICSDLGTEILARRRGNAVDAAVASLLCTGVVNCQSTGIGGGSFFVVYNKKDNDFHAVNFREVAPGAANSTMYTTEEHKGKSLLGGLAVGVPGQVKGLYEVHQRFGSIPWKSVVSPTTRLLKYGYPLTAVVQNHIVNTVMKLDNKAGFEDFLDSNHRPKAAGSLITRPKLAKTFETIEDDPMSFYNGSLAQDIVNDIQERGGIITLEDLKNYRVSWKEPTRLDLPGNLTVFSMPPPGSGAVLSYILSILAGYNLNQASLSTDEARILTYHRIVEAMKFAYAKRSALGDADFVNVTELVQNMTSRSYGELTRSRINDAHTEEVAYYHPDFYNEEDAGTTHLSVVDGDGSAVAVTSTMNTLFGSKVVGERTGIIFNNEMDDFSTPNLTNYFGVPPSESNFIVPGKRPQSSMSPTLVWDHTAGKVVLAVGAAGGTKITTITAKLIMDALWFKMPLPAAMDNHRIHHQLMPDVVNAETGFSSVIEKGLRKKGHKIEVKTGLAVAHAIHVLEDSVVAVSDYRKHGQPQGF